jgi:hypothetical protein
MSQGAARKHLPEPVVWDQAAILSAITRMTSGVTQLTHLTTVPESDTRAVVTRGVSDNDMVAGIADLVDVLARIQLQLSFITGISINRGERG